MKTNHINWEEMWERDFANYVGWTVHSEDNGYFRIKDNREENKENSYQGPDTAHTSDYVQRSPEESMESNDDFLSSSGDLLNKSDGIRYETEGSKADDPDRLYPVDSYIESFPSESIRLDLSAHGDLKGSDEEINNSCLPACTSTGKRSGRQEKICAKTQSDEAKHITTHNIITESSTGQGFSFVTEKAGTAALYSSFPIPKTLGIIAIDTSILKRPKTKIDFTCSIFFEPMDYEGTARLEFLLYSSCNGGFESLIGNWAYDITQGEGLSQTFKISFSSQYSFPGQYNYYVRVLPVYLKSCCVGITDCRLHAIAQSC